MIRYVIRRAGSGLIALFVLVFVLFFVVERFVPGDFFTPLQLGLPPEEVEALREEFGLNRPLLIQFGDWLRDVLTGGFDTTVFGHTSGLYESLPPTIFVFGIGLWIAYVLGSWLGRRTAWKKGAGSDAVTVVGITAYTAFPPFLAFLLVYFLGPQLHDLERAALGDSLDPVLLGSHLVANQVMVRMIYTLAIGAVLVTPLAIYIGRRRGRAASGLLLSTGAVVIAFLWWGVMGIRDQAVSILFEAAIPLLAFVLIAFGEFMLIMQSAMAGVEHDDYIGTARAKGLPDRQIRDRHAGRNALLVLATRLAVSLPYLLTGLVIIERAVSWPGLGDFLFGAIEAQDIPAVMGALVLIGLVVVFVRLGLDVLTGVFDPRIRIKGAE